MKLTIHKNKVHVLAENAQDMVELITRYSGMKVAPEKKTVQMTGESRRRRLNKKTCAICGKQKKNMKLHIKSAHEHMAIGWHIKGVHPTKIPVRSHPELIDA